MVAVWISGRCTILKVWATSLKLVGGFANAPYRILIREAIVFSYPARGSEKSVGGHADQNHLRNLRGVREPPYGSGVSGNIVDTVAVWISGRCTILKIWPASLKLVGGVRERPDRILIREAIVFPCAARGSEKSDGGYADQSHLRNLTGPSRTPPTVPRLVAIPSRPKARHPSWCFRFAATARPRTTMSRAGPRR